MAGKRGSKPSITTPSSNASPSSSEGGAPRLLAGEIAQGLDAVSRCRMGREESAAAGSRGLLEPGQRVDHELFSVVPRPAHDRDRVLVGRGFLRAAVAAQNELARDRGQLFRAGPDLPQNQGARADAHPQSLNLVDVAEIGMGDL